MDAAAQEAKREKELRSLLPTTNVIGYDDNRITSDPRFKLAEALNRAGLKVSQSGSFCHGCLCVRSANLLFYFL